MRLTPPFDISLADQCNRSNTSPEALAAALFGVHESGEAARLLAAVLINESYRTNVVEQSFLHPLGVWKVPLLSYGNDGLELRLHVWEPAIEPAHGWSSYVHNHKWNFASIAVMGQLVMTLFRESKVGGVPHTSVLLSTDGTRSERKVVDRGTIGLTVAYCCRGAAGQLYGLDCDEIHTIAPSGESRYAATLMLRGPYEKRDTLTFARPQEGAEDADNRGVTPMSHADVERVVSMVLESMFVSRPQ